MGALGARASAAFREAFVHGVASQGESPSSHSSSQLGTPACAAVCAAALFAHALKRPLPTRTLADVTACERGRGRSRRNIKVAKKRALRRDQAPLEVSLRVCRRLWASVGACDGVQLSPHDLQLGWQACTFAPVA